MNVHSIDIKKVYQKFSGKVILRKTLSITLKLELYDSEAHNILYNPAQGPS